MHAQKVQEREVVFDDYDLGQLSLSRAAMLGASR
jgi:hypothetical protein